MTSIIWKRIPPVNAHAWTQNYKLKLYWRCRRNCKWLQKWLGVEKFCKWRKWDPRWKWEVSTKYGMIGLKIIITYISITIDIEDTHVWALSGQINVLFVQWIFLLVTRKLWIDAVSRFDYRKYISNHYDWLRLYPNLTVKWQKYLARCYMNVKTCFLENWGFPMNHFWESFA